MCVIIGASCATAVTGAKRQLVTLAASDKEKSDSGTVRERRKGDTKSFLGGASICTGGNPTSKADVDD